VSIAGFAEPLTLVHSISVQSAGTFIRPLQLAAKSICLLEIGAIFFVAFNIVLDICILDHLDAIVAILCILLDR